MNGTSKIAVNKYAPLLGDTMYSLVLQQWKMKIYSTERMKKIMIVVILLIGKFGNVPNSHEPYKYSCNSDNPGNGDSIRNPYQLGIFNWSHIRQEITLWNDHLPENLQLIHRVRARDA